jgi:hypothetical protein
VINSPFNFLGIFGLSGFFFSPIFQHLVTLFRVNW